MLVPILRFIPIRRKIARFLTRSVPVEERNEIRDGLFELIRSVVPVAGRLLAFHRAEECFRQGIVMRSIRGNTCEKHMLNIAPELIPELQTTFLFRFA